MRLMGHGEAHLLSTSDDHTCLIGTPRLLNHHPLLPAYGDLACPLRDADMQDQTHKKHAKPKQCGSI